MLRGTLHGGEGSTHQGGEVTNVQVPNPELKRGKRKQMDVKGEVVRVTITAGDKVFNNNREIRQKISQATEVLDYIIDQHKLICIYKIIHSTTGEENVFFKHSWNAIDRGR